MSNPGKNTQDQEVQPKRLLRGLAPVFLPAFIFSCLINILVSTSPMFMMQTMDRVLPSSNLSTLMMLTLIAAFALGVMSVLEMLRAVMLSRAANWWEAEWGAKLLPTASKGDSKAAETAQDISKVSGFLGGPSVPALFDAPWVILFFILVYMLHPLLALLGGVVAVILFGIALAGHLAGKRQQQEALAARAQANGISSHLDRNAPLLATMGMSDNLLAMHKSLLVQSHQLHARVMQGEQFRKMLAKYARSMLQILTLAMGAWLVLQGQMTGGSMIASSIILARALAPIEQITGLWSGLLEAKLALARLDDLAADAESEEDRTHLPDPIGLVTCEGITMPTQPGQPPRLHNVTFRIRPGECLAVMGSSGSGKSTLASLLSGASSPVIGSVRVDEFDIRHWPADQRAKMIGFLPQAPTLFPGTIAQNIARLHGAPDQGKIVAAAMAAGVHSLISKLPEGYETKVDFETGPLSGGERQRVALARALYEDPKLLVLDEPNASLDKEGERALMTALARLKEAGTCIVLVAHRAGVLALADTILLLDGGRIRDYGPKGEVVNRMNARMMQIELDRSVAELPRLEDWVYSQFKRGGDTDARTNAALVATEMFNLSLSSEGAKDEQKPIVFTFKHRRGVATITMHDNCDLIAAQRIDTARRVAKDESAPTAKVTDDLSLVMLLQLTEAFGQKQLDKGQGRLLVAEVATPVEDADGPAASRDASHAQPAQSVN
ncbi:MAG: type I secretion system permease/ATPase [Pseudomonadota bacterium]